VTVLEPAASSDLTSYEAATAATPEFFFDMMNWESRWPMRPWAERNPAGLSPTMQTRMAEDRLTVEDYRRALQSRAALRARHRGLAGEVDGFITLAHIGPGQLGQPLVGTPWYNDPSSAIGAPTINLPLVSVEGVPLGVQLMGFEGADADLIAMAGWFMAAFGPPTP
jgi:Asp-tRNA(Asn)/Glu-tRNA(Gln) amidotransferase A subunit family amidase